jgi:hypothetical protein
LTGISPEQIKLGLEAIVDREEHWPPNAKEFRQLCVGVKSDHSINSTAYIDFNNPDHPSYKAPRIESDEHKAETRKTGNNELAAMQGLFN